MSERYQGWENWESWHVALLADNEEPVYKRARALGKRCADIRAGQVTGKEYDPARAADAFKRLLAPQWRQTREFHRENWPNDTPGEVNWLEVAEHFMDAAEEG